MKLFKPGLTLTYCHNKKTDFTVGISNQFSNQIFYRDTSSIEIPTMQKKQIYTAEVTGNALMYNFGFTYKFLRKE
jgi:hypothetical protein